MDISIHENGTASIKMSEYIKEAIKGKLCRCTGYKRIVEAIQTESERAS